MPAVTTVAVGFPLFRAISRASAPVNLVRVVASVVSSKLRIKLRLNHHRSQSIEASTGCCVLAIAFSFGG